MDWKPTTPVGLKKEKAEVKNETKEESTDGKPDMLQGEDDDEDGGDLGMAQPVEALAEEESLEPPPKKAKQEIGSEAGIKPPPPPAEAKQEG